MVAQAQPPAHALDRLWSETNGPAGSAPLKQHTAVQFSAEDEGLAEAVTRASVVELEGGVPLRVASVADLIALTPSAAMAPARRPSKRTHDVADVLALLEAHPELASAELLARVQDVRTRLLS
jgi:predicted nucleotidyltransferase